VRDVILIRLNNNNIITPTINSKQKREKNLLFIIFHRNQQAIQIIK